MLPTATPSRMPWVGPSPTPTPTLMLDPRPPQLVYGNCTVRRESHGGGDALVTSVDFTRYNGASRPTMRSYDDSDSDGNRHADGVNDYHHEYSYFDEWLPSLIELYRGDMGGLLSGEYYRYDSLMALTELRHDYDGDGTIDAVDEYQYDDSGRVVRKQGPALAVSYTYDGAGRILTEYWDVLNDGAIDYGYRYVWSDNLITGVGYDNDGDGTVDSTGARTYDNEGRLVFAEDVTGDWSFAYTAEGWLASERLDITGHWESTLEYGYDTEGRLVLETYSDHAGFPYYRRFESRCEEPRHHSADEAKLGFE